ncbi:MAG: T9SS type A sorting domain-containing protein [Cytophagaceae bacterium]|nr:T9SS type A sorting domain-containing protein [Cytophagaceae bacterium]
MKRFSIYLITCAIISAANNLYGQLGYYDAPYVRYEADLGTLTNATPTAKSYAQGNLQSEASDQVCVNMSNAGATVQWTVTTAGDGLVVRYSVPDGQSGVLEVYNGATMVGTLNLTTYYSWEYLSTNGNPNNVGVVNNNPKMRFDEVRMRLPSQIPVGGTLKLVRQSGNIHLDFAELEPVPAAVTAVAGDVVYGGNGSDLQTVIDNNGGRVIYMPAGVYNVNRDLFFGVANTTLKGAGMWYTQIHFTSGAANDGGLWGQAANISYSGLYLTTVRNSRSGSYKAINGVYTNGARITNVWAEHFECGAWIAQFGAGPAVADGLVMSYCRFRNNYADGCNLSKGTINSIVEHCSFRNNGDDDMAIWPANNQECRNNTYRYNTSENCWRASGCAIYGGFSNIAHNLLIKDNLEVGLRVGNNFGGSPFNAGGMHQFYNIRIIACGTYNDLFNAPVGAIDLLVTNIAGTRVENVKFSCIDIVDSKNDAIYMKKNSGDGFYNVVFENISINGTGREYPNNGGAVGGRGYMVLFNGNPAGSATYCGMTYSNRGGSAATDISGTFSWNAAGSCPGGCSLPSTSSTTLTSATTFGICNNPVTLTATTTPPSGNTVSYIEFFVDGISKGTDNSSPYSALWSNPTVGDHAVTAVARYSGGTTSTSAVQTVTIADGIYSTPGAPVIDGTIDALWNSYASFNLNTVSVGTISGPADLSASFKITRDATNLYILVDVTDDVLRNDSPNNWEDDALEIFIDMGNDKSVTYGANDFAYTFGWNDPTVYESYHSPGSTAGVTFAQGAKTGGYIMEIRIPWTALGGAPAVGSFTGFDLQVNDDDDGGTRDAKKVWEDATDVAWNNPSVLGTLQIAGCTNPLPVELLVFAGEIKNEGIALSWITSQERGNKKFIIERSIDLSDWQEIGQVAGAGNAATVVNYNFTDYAYPAGIIYYRLRQIDVGGASVYSSVIVMQSNAHPISISPNPFEDELHIQSSIEGEMEISICDVLGRLVYQVTAQSGNGTLHLHPDLPSGSYLIIIQSNDTIEQRKIVKK